MIRSGITYEDPNDVDGDGFATAWCWACDRGMGILSDDLLRIYRWCKSHNASEHDHALSIRMAGDRHGGDRKSDPARDAVIHALAVDGLSSAAIAAYVGLSASGVRSALKRLR